MPSVTVRQAGCDSRAQGVHRTCTGLVLGKNCKLNETDFIKKNPLAQRHSGFEVCALCEPSRGRGGWL